MKLIQSILVATDLTEVSDEVLRAAGALAARTGAKLHILHAFDFQVLPYSDAAHAHITFAGRIEEAKRALDAQIGRTVRPGVEVASREVVIYVAYRAILERAEEVGADLRSGPAPPAESGRPNPGEHCGPRHPHRGGALPDRARAALAAAAARDGAA
jgi:nucleotide-binding universal stress UspA family protein